MRKFTGDKRIGIERTKRLPRIVGLCAVLILVYDLGAKDSRATVITPPIPTQITGTYQTVASGPGDQVNPHVDCNLATYTNDTGTTNNVHYFNFGTNSDATVPT